MISPPARGMKIQGKAVVIYRPKSAAITNGAPENGIEEPSAVLK